MINEPVKKKEATGTDIFIMGNCVRSEVEKKAMSRTLASVMLAKTSAPSNATQAARALCIISSMRWRSASALLPTVSANFCNPGMARVRW